MTHSRTALVTPWLASVSAAIGAHGTGPRIFSLGSAGLIVSIVSARVDVAALTYGTVENRLMVPDCAGFKLDIDEFGSSR